MPVSIHPDSWTLLQNKAQDIVLRTHTVPDQKGSIVAVPLNGIVPLLRGKVADAPARPIVYAFLLQAVEINDVKVSLLCSVKLVSAF